MQRRTPPSRSVSAISPALAAWSVRLLWLVVGLTGVWAIAEALRGRSTAATVAVSVAGWLLFGVTLAASLVPSTVSLTVVRAIGPTAVVAAIVALVGGSGAVRGAAFLASSLLAAALFGAGEIGEAFAQGSAYGDEQRFPLRPPAALLAPVLLSWTAWTAVATAATLLLGGGRWIVGGVLAVSAVATAWPLGQRYHRLSRRWLVVVPAGLVVHDPVVLAETLLVQRAALRTVGLALAATQAADLTGPAAGHALDVAVGDAVTITFAATHAEPNGRAVHAYSFLVAPTRPGRALAAVAVRGFVAAT